MRDWTEIETMYIAGNMSQKELAESLNISYSTLSKMATENKWSAKRKKFREKTANKGLERAGARISRKLAKLAEGTERLIDVALKALGDEQQFYRYIVTDGMGEGVSVTKEEIFEKLDAKALKDVTAALRDLTAMRRDLFGIPTQSETVAQKIARERLELEKRKVEAELAEKETGDGDRNIHVVMEGGAEELSQ
jgi:IS30 family transposase